MQPISISERLWLEPTILGATLNYAEGADGWHYRVGIGFRSLSECDKVIHERDAHWMLRDKSFLIEGDTELVLTFCPGTYMERRFVLQGAALETFKNAIHFLTLASEPRLN